MPLNKHIPALGPLDKLDGFNTVALTASAAAAPAGGVGAAAGGYDTAANRDLAIATINNLKTRVDELEARLKALTLVA